MPRTPRIVLPDHPHHVVHRGHNRNPVFFSRKDRLSYLSHLAELKDEHLCQVYSYCLMTNHVHLVISPGKGSENLSDLMQRLAIRHTMRVNGIHGWSGTLWEGRFRSNPIRSEKYLLACCRYVELNPVRAGIVRKASGYRWSSYRARAGYAAMGWLDEDHCYRNLAQEKHERQRKYRRLTEASVSDDEAKMIRKAIRRGEIMDENAEITLISENAPIYEGLSLM